MNRETIAKARKPQEEEVSDGTMLNRRSFVQLLGAGLLITVTEGISVARRRSRSRGPSKISARVHIDEDGTITVMTGKVEEGQGARAELTQVAAEELHVRADQIRLVMADTALVPDDGITAGSRTTPYTVPSVRRGCAAARVLLERFAAEQFKVERNVLDVKDGIIKHAKSKRAVSYADLAKRKDVSEAFSGEIPSDVRVRGVEEWEVMGTSVPRANLRDLVTGAHRYPSDISRENMLYGKILRPPSYGATLESIDLSSAKAMKDVVVVREGNFVGCAAPSSYLAEQAVEAIGRTAKWKETSHISSKDLFTHLKKNARYRGDSNNEGFDRASKVLSENYEVAFIQHTPMEPRAAVAEWKDGNLTGWAGVDWPQRAQRDFAGVFGIPSERIRVIVPDMGCGFGGKHSCEAGEEAARLAKAAGRPVSLQWTREEEFTWAYFRPAALIECKGGLDEKGSLVAWDFTNINAGGSAIDAPYNIPAKRTRSVGSDSPLKQGPYRCLAATANNFARESFIDELAAAAEADPLAFRLAHLNNDRIRTVLEAAAKHFNWAERKRKVTDRIGVGLACGTEKNSVVAACVEVEIDRKRGEIKVLEVCEVFECGPIINPDNLTSQVQGCIIMGLGAALREEMIFEGGKILNSSFADYRVPRFKDVPKIDVHLINKTDIPSAGGGETPIIAIAPAIGNAVFATTGIRLRSMPMRTEKLKLS
ncbi:MAG: xanthine dehydrogenase family protein molybdopterin-binding subunit [Planctomycetota bacterium]|jgi:isoquinoline 1-oxidoreductase